MCVSCNTADVFLAGIFTVVLECGISLSCGFKDVTDKSADWSTPVCEISEKLHLMFSLDCFSMEACKGLKNLLLVYFLQISETNNSIPV